MVRRMTTSLRRIAVLLVLLMVVRPTWAAPSSSDPSIHRSSDSPECRAVMPTCPDPKNCADLTVDGPRAQASAYVVIQEFTADSCAVVEGCTQVGSRKLLRFDMSTPNIGKADLHLGDPSLAKMEPCFVWSPCHAHYHFTAYADFALIDPKYEGDSEHVVARGAKSSSCLMDGYRIPGDDNKEPVLQQGQIYTCQNQGIHKGYLDLYGGHLDCQWIDVTGLTPGTYTMRLEVNKARVLPEADYTNNVAEFPIVVPADSDLPPPVNPAGCPQHGGCSSCSNSRGCGWCASMGYCAYGTYTGPATGSCSDWIWSAARCESLPPPVTEPPLVEVCPTKQDCAACAAHEGCGWCHNTHKCSAGIANGPLPESGASCTAGWTFGPNAQCDFDECPAQTDCNSCCNTPRCGWCATPDAVNGTCARGSWLGPSDGSCSADSWKWGLPQCIIAPPKVGCKGKDIVLPPLAQNGECPSGDDELSSGSHCNLKCPPGYTQHPGSGRQACDDGKWSGAAPDCSPDGCTVPVAPTGTNIGCKVGTRIPSGSTFTYGVNAGYALKTGSLTRTCFAGAFTSAAPEMELVDPEGAARAAAAKAAAANATATAAAAAGVNAVSRVSRRSAVSDASDFADAPVAVPSGASVDAATTEVAPVVATSTPRAVKECRSATSCSSCAALPHCGWCSDSQVCTEGSWTGSSAPSNSSCASRDVWAWSMLDCLPPPPSAERACAQAGSCSSCAALRGCGWCATTEACTAGTWTGPFASSPSSASCPSFVWSALACSWSAALDAEPNPSLADLSRRALVGPLLESSLSKGDLAALESIRPGMLRPDRLESLLSSMQLSMDELLKADPAGNLLKQEDPLANGFKEDPEGNFLKNLHRNEVNLTRLLNQQGQHHRRRGRHGGAGAGARRGRGAPDNAAAPVTAAGAADTDDDKGADDASSPMMDLYPRAPIDAWDSFPDDPRFPHGHTEHVHSHLGQGDHDDHTNAPPPPGMQRDVRGGAASAAAANTEAMPGMDMGMEHAMGASSDSMGHTSSSSSPAQPSTPVDQHGRRRRALLEDSSTSTSSTGAAAADPGAVCNGVNEPIPPLPEPEPSSSSSSSSTGDDGSSGAVDGGQTGANTGPDDGGVIARPSSAEPTQRRTMSLPALLVALMAVAGAMRM